MPWWPLAFGLAMVMPAAPKKDASTLLERAHALVADLEYQRALPLVERALAADSLGHEQKLSAYLLQAKCYAAVKDPLFAEKPFRLLLRANPSYELDPKTSPKIIAVFRKVQAEERAIRTQLAALERKRIIETISLQGALPEEAKGGLPLLFHFRLRDPTGAVDRIEVPYRRQGERSFSILALQVDEAGRWHGSIPGEWTSTDEGFDVQFLVRAVDRVGPLLTIGSEAAPRSLVVMPGQLERGLPRVIPRPVFWVTAASAIIAAGVGGGLRLAANSKQSEYDELAAASITGAPVNADVLAATANQGRDLVIASTASFITGAGLAVVAAILLPFLEEASE